MNKYFRIIIWLVFIFGGLFLSIFLDQHLLHFLQFEKDIWNKFVFILGVLLFVSVFNIAGNVGRTLAKYGRKSKDLERLQTDQLVTKGVYSMMRHPMNQGLIMMPLAIALMGVSPSFIFIIAPIEMLAMYIMIRTIEEPETRKKFGKDYDEYCARTPRFCFKWKCIKALLKNPDAEI
ncbi:MAG: isoprenylcysteine carboxylmethyltransferase family protein [Bacteroidetes bacterium]|nr:MAG: isoprenylcysteine carboxylmethyltransferase family protein [Bacteroidota bacterium]